MACIFCDSMVNLNTIEHIVNESLVNYHYTLPKGVVCDKCNNNFSKFEGKVLSRSIIGFERARLGTVTKKGKAAKGTSGNVQFEGDKHFRKNLVVASGLNSAKTGNIDPHSKTFTVEIEGFDKSEMAMSKFLLKIGFESIYKSRRELFINNDFKELKLHLTYKNGVDWPFLTSQMDANSFISIPRFNDRYQLKRNSCELFYCQVDDHTLLFKFRYGGFVGIMNLYDRSMDWCIPYIDLNSNVGIFPVHIHNKLKDYRGS